VPREIRDKVGRSFAKSVVIWRPEEPREFRVKLLLNSPVNIPVRYPELFLSRFHK